MARKIDPDKPLSDEDRQWLTDWARYAQIEEHDRNHPPKGVQAGDDASGEPEEPENPLKGEEPTHTDLTTRVDPVTGEPVEGSDDGDDGEDEGGDWYEDEGVTVPDLQEELGKRELSKSGNKQELIDRLREADANEG